MCILKFSKYGKLKRGRCGALRRKAVPLLDLTLQGQSTRLYVYKKIDHFCKFGGHAMLKPFFYFDISMPQKTFFG
jgi:hypothetical protein